MEAEARAQEAVAAQEMAWEGERRRVGLAKLRDFFLGGVEVERVVVHALLATAPATVATFRTARLSPAVQVRLCDRVWSRAVVSPSALHQPKAPKPYTEVAETQMAWPSTYPPPPPPCEPHSTTLQAT